MFVDRWDDGWEAEYSGLLQNTHQINRERVKAKISQQPKKGRPWIPRKKDFVSIISHRRQVNTEERFSRLGFKWETQFQQITQIEVKPGKKPKLSLLTTLSS